MSGKPISQREARALRKRVKELEARDHALRCVFANGYPGTWVMRVATDPTTLNVARTAKRLGFQLVAKLDNDSHFDFYAIPTETTPTEAAPMSKPQWVDRGFSESVLVNETGRVLKRVARLSGGTWGVDSLEYLTKEQAQAACEPRALTGGRADG